MNSSSSLFLVLLDDFGPITQSKEEDKGKQATVENVAKNMAGSYQESRLT